MAHLPFADSLPQDFQNRANMMNTLRLVFTFAGAHPVEEFIG